jgi:hypothetical protein
MAVTSNTVANQALALIGDNIPPVQGNAPNFDSSAAGTVLSQLYASCVRTVAKQFSWDFARTSVGLTVSGGSPAPGWSYEYLYPTYAVEIYQIQPVSISDINNPLPQNWMVGNNLVSGSVVKVIWCNLASAKALVDNNPPESIWDAGFQEAVVRLLASELAMALFGRPDTMQQYLESGGSFETIAEARPA